MIFVILIQHHGILQTRVALGQQDRAQESGGYSFVMDYQFRYAPGGGCFDRIGRRSQERLDINESVRQTQVNLRHFSADSAPDEQPYSRVLCYSLGNGFVRL
jgi:hypothetical protein